MNRQFERYLQITLILLDLLILNTIYFLSQIILRNRYFPISQMPILITGSFQIFYGLCHRLY